MLRIFQDTHYQFREEIRKLYMDTFSHGDAAQHIDPEELDKEIRLTYEEGMMMVAVDDEDESKLTGALFVYPLQYDAGFNPQLSDVCDKVHTPYIAEVMVKEKYRRRGLGGKMIRKTLSSLRENRFKEVFIRVWDRNMTALRLYRDAGFEVVGKILQKKWFTDRKTRILMEKLYMKRGL